MTIALAWLLAVLVVIAFIRGCRDDKPHVKYDEGEPFKELRKPSVPKTYLNSKEAYRDFDYPSDGPAPVVWPDEKP